ncbi:hypothetical protein GXW82_23570 [Streptacidiphilus sp. 4-A2]|nr:hypothetical protein [Streptacidiphilus sp. 4-A2]
MPVESRAWQEELVLADLLQNGDQVAEVQVWLSPDSFEPGPRREVYEAILTVYEQGEPVNELTVAWQLGRDSSAVVYAEEVEVRRSPQAPSTWDTSWRLLWWSERRSRSVTSSSSMIFEPNLPPTRAASF